MATHVSWREAAACRDADPELFSRSVPPGPHCARSRRRGGSAGPARRKLRVWPGRWIMESAPVYGEGLRRPSGAPSADPRRGTSYQRGRRLCR